MASYFAVTRPIATRRRSPRSSGGTARCFSAHLERNVFHCFKCGQKGNAIDLWSRATNQPLYEAAADLGAKLGIPLPLLNPTRSPTEPVTLDFELGTIPKPHPGDTP